MAERFWWLLTIVALVWYSSVTIYVAIRGAFDIRRMLETLPFLPLVLVFS